MQLLLEQEGLRAGRSSYQIRLPMNRPGLDQSSLSWQVCPSRLSLSVQKRKLVRPDALIVTNQIRSNISKPWLSPANGDLPNRGSDWNVVKLLTLLSYPNVVLSKTLVAKIRNSTSCRISIWHQLRNELLDAVRQAFEYNMLILAFDQTAHNRPYTAPEHLFNLQTVGDMIAKIQEALSSLDKMGQALDIKVAMLTMWTWLLTKRMGG